MKRVNATSSSCNLCLLDVNISAHMSKMIEVQSLSIVQHCLDFSFIAEQLSIEVATQRGKLVLN